MRFRIGTVIAVADTVIAMMPAMVPTVLRVTPPETVIVALASEGASWLLLPKDDATRVTVPDVDGVQLMTAKPPESV